VFSQFIGLPYCYFKYPVYCIILVARVFRMFNITLIFYMNFLTIWVNSYITSAINCPRLKGICITCFWDVNPKKNLKISWTRHMSEEVLLHANTSTVIESNHTTENIILGKHIAGTQIYPSKNYSHQKDRGEKRTRSFNTYGSATSRTDIPDAVTIIRCAEEGSLCDKTYVCVHITLSIWH